MTAASPLRIERARAAVRRTLGATLAAKASDDLCIALADAAPAALFPVFEFEHRPRRAGIAALRRHFEQVTRELAAELRDAHPRAPIHSCWLNGTLQASADRLLLADLAHIPQLEHIDVARRLCFHDSSGPASGPPTNVVLDGASRVRERLGLSGVGITVGVIDTEVMRDHPALPRVERGTDFTGNGFGDPGRHGTWVAGIIAADGSLLPPDAREARRFMGVAPRATIRSYKMPGSITDIHGTRAIQQALEDGLRVVNCSWGAEGVVLDGMSRVTKACNAAWLHGMAVVKSVGTSGEVTAPADAKGSIVVGSASLLGTALEKNPPHEVIGGRLRPDLVAPGDGRPWSTVLSGGIGQVTRGSSIAAPHVTGLLALLLEREPSLKPDDLRARVLAACRRIASQPLEPQGHGLVSPELLFGL